MDEKDQGYHREGLRILRIPRSWVGDAGVILVDVRVNSETVESRRYEIELV